jgi:hypothetical protein
VDELKTYDAFIKEMEESYYFHIEKAKSHIAEAERFKNLLQASRSFHAPTGNHGDTPAPVFDYQNGSVTFSSKINKRKSNKTFESFITDLLNDVGRPVYSQEIITAYKKEYGVDIERKDLSSKLSILAKNKGLIKYEELKGVPPNLKYWWGYSSWYDGDEFNYEYKNKIMEYIKELSDTIAA